MTETSKPTHAEMAERQLAQANAGFPTMDEVAAALAGAEGVRKHTHGLVEFLRARLNEDLGPARYATTRDDVQDENWAGWWLGHYEHYSRYTPKRVLADLIAKRRIVEAFDARDRDVDLMLGESGSPLRQREWAGLSLAVRILAAAYVDHPDYQEAWML